MSFGIIDSFDESAEVDVVVAGINSVDYVLLTVISDSGNGAALYLDSEAARALAKALIDFSANVA